MQIQPNQLIVADFETCDIRFWREFFFDDDCGSSCIVENRLKQRVEQLGYSWDATDFMSPADQHEAWCYVMRQLEI